MAVHSNQSSGDDYRHQFSHREIYEQYKAAAFAFTKAQWAAIQLYYKHDRTEAEVAEILEIDRRTVHGRLKRARERLLKHQREMRREQFELQRAMMEQDRDS